MHRDDHLTRHSRAPFPRGAPRHPFPTIRARPPCLDLERLQSGRSLNIGHSTTRSPDRPARDSPSAQPRNHRPPARRAEARQLRATTKGQPVAGVGEDAALPSRFGFAPFAAGLAETCFRTCAKDSLGCDKRRRRDSSGLNGFNDNRNTVPRLNGKRVPLCRHSLPPKIRRKVRRGRSHLPSGQCGCS
jgi:hypothetical protein